MKLVIDISEKVYENVMNGIWCGALFNALKNGIPLPKGHGDLIDRKDLIEDFKDSKKISFAERMDISCIVDHAPTVIESDTESEDKE